MTDADTPVDPRIYALIKQHARRARNHATLLAVAIILLIIAGSLYAGALWAKAQVNAAWERVQRLEAFQELRDRAQHLVASIEARRDEIQTAFEDIDARRAEARQAAKDAIAARLEIQPAIDQLKTAIDDAATQGGLIPDGVVLPWLGEQLPRGWVVCDGTDGTPRMVGLTTEGDEGFTLRFMMRKR